VDEEGLCAIGFALAQIHFPSDREALTRARDRLIFEELFLLQAGLAFLKNEGASEGGEDSGIAFGADARPEDFESLLPFDFTGAQRRVVQEVYADMEAARAMNRLIQGDVGSGKTAVAAAAVYKAVRSGCQAALMAPTELLAKQHCAELSHLFGESGVCGVSLLTSGMGAKARGEVLAGLRDGTTGLAVGTHALLQEDVSFARLGLVITDEQHRFGVRQRVGLARKNRDADAPRPDVLVMTATPIPRTLAFVLYGDLDISVIDELPPGRKKVVTKAVGSARRGRVYDFVRGEIEGGGQVYVVAPLIEDGEGELAGMLRSSESLHAELSQRFAGHEVALLHGAMRQDEKDAVMQGFSEGRISVLVSTVVIEVGVNVPNATVMVVENAERFGLAQLHQLRGRVGRGRAQSWCILVSDSESQEARQRMETMEQTDDGFAIAEKDLAMRGPGELFGTRQHGIPSLRIADLSKHVRTAARARDAAAHLLAGDPGLEAPAHYLLRETILTLFQDVREMGI
ncbi:MAG: ATP-dependent DNA helicase RecG, partial [Clostridiales Family XIII bacterium]|jgi:ATP-dependent DNA helicase RecG|nr:ATP-dependent DNA helicase RecG [Clostridiales Family XIII bacterium]